MKHCQFCKNGNYIPGRPGTFWEPPEPDEIDCAIPTEEMLEEFDPAELPKHCGGYDPVYAEECGNCGKPMNIPLHEVEFMFESDIPCCSEECQEALYKKTFGELED